MQSLKMVLTHSFWLLWVLFACQLIRVKSREGASAVQGKKQVCYNEGEPVVVDGIAQYNNCYPCMCKNGFVQCLNKCPNIDNCHLAYQGECCKLCKGCRYKGVEHLSYTEWTDPIDPCKIFSCEAGIITTSEMRCFTPCDNPLPPEPGKCCQSCPGCRMIGQIIPEERDVVWENDPCLKCRCRNGKMTCFKKACPILQCQQSTLPPGECCPRCVGTRQRFTLSGRCPVQNNLYLEGETHNLDKCTECKCLNGTAICSRGTCPILDCATEQQKHLPNFCCPICVKSNLALTAEISSECRYNSNIYKDGNEWQIDECSSCNCNHGKVRCVRMRCNSTCSIGMKKVHFNGECCPRCVEEQSGCMVFGGLHYKTFDGKLYNFRGYGKYQFIEQCQNSTFSIRVANEMVNKYMNSPITKRVAVTFDGGRLNLQQKLRVKYNGEKINLPYKKDGQFSITKIDGHIEVKLQNGVLIIWNGKSFLEVSVPSIYKGKLCGLCGNFNGDTQDDLKMRSGKIVTKQDLAAFGNSWSVGGKKLHDRSKKIPMVKDLYGDVTICKSIEYKEFSACKNEVFPGRYYKTCKLDMFNCINGGCHCDSLMAYSRDCEREGIKLPNWKKSSNCDHRHHQQQQHHHVRQKFTNLNHQKTKSHKVSKPITRKNLDFLPIH